MLRKPTIRGVAREKEASKLYFEAHLSACKGQSRLRLIEARSDLLQDDGNQSISDTGHQSTISVLWLCNEPTNIKNVGHKTRS